MKHSQLISRCWACALLRWTDWREKTVGLSQGRNLNVSFTNWMHPMYTVSIVQLRKKSCFEWFLWICILADFGCFSIILLSNVSILGVPHEDYSRNVSCALDLISMFSLFSMEWSTIGVHSNSNNCLLQRSVTSKNWLHYIYRVYPHKHMIDTSYMIRLNYCVINKVSTFCTLTGLLGNWYAR